MKKEEQWEVLFDLIPNTLKNDYTIVFDQINSKTFALAKWDKKYSERYSIAHEPVSGFYTFSECKSFLMGMQLMIKIRNEKSKN